MNNKTAKELKAIAKELNIKGFSSMKKDNLITAIQEAQEGAKHNPTREEFNEVNKQFNNILNTVSEFNWDIKELIKVENCIYAFIKNNKYDKFEIIGLYGGSEKGNEVELLLNKLAKKFNCKFIVLNESIYNFEDNFEELEKELIDKYTTTEEQPEQKQMLLNSVTGVICTDGTSQDDILCYVKEYQEGKKMIIKGHTVEGVEIYASMSINDYFEGKEYIINNIEKQPTTAAGEGATIDKDNIIIDEDTDMQTKCEYWLKNTNNNIDDILELLNYIIGQADYILDYSNYTTLLDNINYNNTLGLLIDSKFNYLLDLVNNNKLNIKELYNICEGIENTEYNIIFSNFYSNIKLLDYRLNNIIPNYNHFIYIDEFTGKPEPKEDSIIVFNNDNLLVKFNHEYKEVYIIDPMQQIEGQTNLFNNFNNTFKLITEPEKVQDNNVIEIDINNIPMEILKEIEPEEQAQPQEEPEGSGEVFGGVDLLQGEILENYFKNKILAYMYEVTNINNSIIDICKSIESKIKVGDLYLYKIKSNIMNDFKVGEYNNTIKAFNNKYNTNINNIDIYNYIYNEINNINNSLKINNNTEGKPEEQPTGRDPKEDKNKVINKCNIMNNNICLDSDKHTGLAAYNKDIYPQ
jgi:hypothetical protein